MKPPDFWRNAIDDAKLRNTADSHDMGKK